MLKKSQKRKFFPFYFSLWPLRSLLCTCIGFIKINEQRVFDWYPKIDNLRWGCKYGMMPATVKIIMSRSCLEILIDDIFHKLFSFIMYIYLYLSITLALVYEDYSNKLKFHRKNLLHIFFAKKTSLA